MLEKNSIKKSPKNPGVYLFKEGGKIIYVGKAKNLKSRLSSYFLKNASIKAKKIVKNSDEINWTVTDTEHEAFILEHNLIQENKPRYNVIFRDDKSYVFVKVDYSSDFPGIELVRANQVTRKPKDLLIGPFTDSRKVKELVDFAKSIFAIGNCGVAKNAEKDGYYHPKKNERACLHYHIGKCSGTCIGKISKDEYKKMVDRSVSFLKGDFSKAKEILMEKMKKLAESKRFEAAINLRNIYQTLDELLKRQKVYFTEKINADFLGIAKKKTDSIVTIFQLREGKLVGKESLKFITPEEDEVSYILEKAILKYYKETTFLPKKIYSKEEISEEVKSLLQSFDEAKKIEIIVPKIGDKRKLCDLAKKNSVHELQKRQVKWEKDDTMGAEGIEAVSEFFKKEIERVEGFDVSHSSGSLPVASMVVFELGIPKKSHYRKFNLISTPRSDDYAGLQEAVNRRFVNFLKSEKPKQEIGKLEKAIGDTKEEIQSLKKEIKNVRKMFEKLEKNLTKKSGKKDKKSDEKNKEDLKRELEILNSEIEKHEHNLTPKEKGYENLTEELKDRKKQVDPSFSTLPDLLLIDGGKGQLSAVLDVLGQYFDKIPFQIVSLAKKEEILFIGEKKEEVILPRNSKVLQLLQRVRDESHRFAVTGNRNRREKTAFKSALDDIEGVGEKTRKKLLKHFGSVNGIRNAKKEELEEIVGEKLSTIIRSEL